MCICRLRVIEKIKLKVFLYVVSSSLSNGVFKCTNLYEIWHGDISPNWALTETIHVTADQI